MKKNNKTTELNKPKDLLEMITDKWLEKVGEVTKLQIKIDELEKQLIRKHTIMLN